MTKRKILKAGALLAMLLGILACLMIFHSKGATMASASSHAKSHAQMDYVFSVVENGVKRTKNKGKSSTLQLNMSEHGKTMIGLSFLRNDETDTISYEAKFDEPFSYHDFTVSYAASFKSNKMSLYDDSGNLLAYDSNTPKAAFSVNLDDGHYHIVIESVGYPWESNANTHYLFEATYDFYIDTQKPYFEGAGLDKENPPWVKVGHTVKACDKASGPYLFYKYNPGEMFTSPSSSMTEYTFGDADQEGVYMFSVYDRAMQQSKMHYVGLDKTAPVGGFVTESGAEIETGGTIDQSFSFSASDEVSGIKSIEYKIPSTDVWIAYTAGTVIPNNSPMGKYDFRCKDRADNEVTYSINLSHNFKTQVTAATCTAQGFTTFTCEDCGYSYVGDYVSELGHRYTDTRVEATCTKKGYTRHRCVRCNKTYQDTPVRELGHDFLTTTVSPSCNEGGYVLNSCTRCGESNRTETAQPLGHHYVATTISATCTEGGYTNHACTRCGDQYRDNVSQANGHNYIIKNVLPTCTEYGKTQYECQVCGYLYSAKDGTYPTGHNYTTTIVIAPTCTTEGLRRSVCDECGDSFDTVIAANGHAYLITDSVSENNITTREYTCTECNETYKQVLGDQYEEVANYVEYLFDQYSPYMWWVLLAAAGVWSIVMGVFFAIAQKHEDKEKAKKMIINYLIGLVVIAVIVVACPYLIRGIAALVT